MNVNENTFHVEFYSMTRRNYQHNIDESQNHYVVWKQPGKKQSIVFESIYRKFQIRQNWATLLENGTTIDLSDGIDCKGQWGDFLG